jgi:hypothetical protein
VVQCALGPLREPLSVIWQERDAQGDDLAAPPDETERMIAASLVPIVTDASTAALRSLYPDAPALGESAQTMPLPAQ